MAWSVVQAARLLKLSPKFVYDLIKHGYLTTERVSGKHTISNENFQAYLKLYPPGKFPKLPKAEPGEKRSFHTAEYRAERLQFLKDYAKTRGGDCISVTYLGSSIDHEWACANGHTWFARPRHVVGDKTWCRACFDASRRKKPLPETGEAAL